MAFPVAEENVLDEEPRSFHNHVPAAGAVCVFGGVARHVAYVSEVQPFRVCYRFGAFEEVGTRVEFGRGNQFPRRIEHFLASFQKALKDVTSCFIFFRFLVDRRNLQRLCPSVTNLLGCVAL